MLLGFDTEAVDDGDDEAADVVLCSAVGRYAQSIKASAHRSDLTVNGDQIFQDIIVFLEKNLASLSGETSSRILSV